MATWRKVAQGLISAATLAAAGPALAAPTAASLFYERALMTAADASCRLFAPPVAASLAAAKAQARGAALRSGADAASLQALEARAAATAQTAGCGSPDIALAATRVRSAFDGYARLDAMRYPGDTAEWFAQRPADDGLSHWRLSQRTRFGWDVMVFGLAGRGTARPLMAVASFADGARPYGARLILRDVARTMGPYLDTREADLNGRIPLDGRLPPASASRVFNAEALSPAGSDLRPADLDDGWAFRFPAAASDALAALDPRESVAVEFLFAGDGGDETRTAYVEVGDFVAGRAFQSLGRALVQR